MKTRNMVVLLVIAGVLGIVAALWSGSGAGLGPIQMGEGELSAGTRNMIMVLTLIGAVGALLTGAVIKLIGRKILGIASLVFGALMVPSVFQANVLAIMALLLLVLVGIVLLSRPPVEGSQSSSP
ncbi:MAG: hypothetical protein K9M82_11630 [Deltaproteobacteria bacterium]|nr:hypothetical protein [Deltaproteobacteria bacterium]